MKSSCVLGISGYLEKQTLFTIKFYKFVSRNFFFNFYCFLFQCNNLIICSETVTLRIEGSLDRVYFAADLEFIMVLGI